MVLNFHNKADGSERRIAMYLIENFRMAVELEVSQNMVIRCHEQKLIHNSLGYTSHSWCKQRLCATRIETGGDSGALIDAVAASSSGS